MRTCLTIDDVGDLDALDNGTASILRVEGPQNRKFRLATIDECGRLRSLDSERAVFDRDRWSVSEVVA